MGSYTLDEAARFNGCKTLFPGNAIGHSSGGIPEKIPETTWAHRPDYHQRYYHPSNSHVCLYGRHGEICAERSAHGLREEQGARRDAVAVTYVNLGNPFRVDTSMHLLLRTESSVDVESALYSYMNEFDYYAFLGGVLEKPEQEPGEVARHLDRVQGLLHNRTNAVSGYAGSKEGAAVHRTAADAFLQRLDVRPIEKHDYQLPRCAQREAMVLNSQVQYNLVFASYEQLGLDGYIMSSCDVYAQPGGELSGALSAMLDVVQGRPQDENLAYMQALKDVTVESLSDYAQVYQNLIMKGVRSTAGSASAIEAHKELYEQIIPVN